MAIPNDGQIKVVSPGRVNLLGEHVDYNDGWVLPIAIDREITIEAEPSAGDEVHLTARDLDDNAVFSLSSLAEKKDIAGNTLPSWVLYPAGVAWALQKRGLDVHGLNAVFHSSLPIGAGLSSSAALEVGFAVLWQAVGGWSLDRMNLARLCQEAEVAYVGMNCGLMDQFACANGVAGHAMLLDTRTFDWRPIPIPAGVSIIIADSRVQHKLVDSAYNTRHEECSESVRILQTKFPDITALRDVSLDQLRTMEMEMPENVYRRARHIVTECERVQKAAAFFEAGNSRKFGELMFQAHASLRDDYEVSCKELDILVDLAAALPGCLGARLTGAGFGGSTVNLVQNEAAAVFMEKLQQGYRAQTGLEANIFQCKASEGARVVL